MRLLVPSLALAVVLCTPTLSYPQGLGVLQFAMEAQCHKPDSSLIVPGTQDTYNAQAKGFNDCLRVYVETENNKINQIRAQARDELGHIAETYNSQIRDVERAIKAAIAEVKVVNGEIPETGAPPPAEKGQDFTASECKRPDEALLQPSQGQSSPSMQSTDKFEQQRLGYESCVRTFIAQSKGKISQLVIDAQTAFHKVTENANSRISQINNNVTQALNDVHDAAAQRDAAVHAFHSPWTVSSHWSGSAEGFDRAEKTRYGTVTVTEGSLSPSADTPDGAGQPAPP
jgi:hypothetical protein